MERKTRRISYTKKAKDQRRNLFIILYAALLFCLCSFGATADGDQNALTVTVTNGDSLWSICKTYQPEDMELRLFIDKVMYENDLKSSTLSIGQELVIPLS